jgi:hypothetical protein
LKITMPAKIISDVLFIVVYTNKQQKLSVMLLKVPLESGHIWSEKAQVEAHRPQSTCR